MITIKRILPFFKLQILAFVFALVTAPLLLWLSQEATNELVQARNVEEHTYRVLNQLAHLRTQVETVETARRGYVITHQDIYLRPYQQARQQIEEDLGSLRALTADNPRQQERLTALEPILESLKALAKKDIAVYVSDPTQVAETMAHAKFLVDQSRGLIEQMSGEENVLLGERSRDSATKLRQLKIWLVGISLAFMGLLTFAFIHGQREIRQRRKVEERLLRSQAETHETVHNLSLMSEMTSLLQACSDTDESLDVICQYAARLLPMDSGALFLFRESRNQLELSVNWGAESKSEIIFDQEDCWALRRGEPHILDHSEHSLACRHLHDWADISSLCVPIVAQGNVLGILHMEKHGANQEINESEISLANNLGSQIALAMASIKLRDTLRNLSVRDPLTGLFNRRYMEESLNREIATAQRKDRPLALVILDLDYFKKFNDTFGHEAGDLLLREVGSLLAKKSRGSDIACRFGGEEFVMIYPEATPETAIQLANQLREAIFAMQVQHFGRSLGQISASFGLSFFPTHGTTTDEMLRAADKALYAAKAAGRNRVEIAQG